MIAKKLRKLLLLCTFALLCNTIYATPLIDGYTVNYDAQEVFAAAENKFFLSNISAAHNDFETLVNSGDSKDFYLLNQAIALAEYGFFDLTDAVFSKIEDYEISKNYLRDIKKFYYPAKRMEKSQIITLAEAYSNIIYNDYAQEAVLDIINNNLLSNNDYTAYILALGYYETKDFEQAHNYISLAISQNSENINYKILLVKILLELNDAKKAFKLLDELKKESFVLKVFQNKILALEQFYFYKTQKNDKQKNIHLAHYYLLQGKKQAAQRVLLSNITNNKKLNGEIYALLAQSYYGEDDIKAVEYANKSLKNRCEKGYNYIILGNAKRVENNFKQALRYLNRVISTPREVQAAMNLTAQIYYDLNKKKQAQKIWLNLSKKYPENPESYYNLAKEMSNDSEILLKKSLSYDVGFKPAYYELFEIYFERENYNLAREYLNNVKYIDENDFRYYYYLSQLEFALGNDTRAEEYKSKCLLLDASCRDILNKERSIEK